MTVFGRQYAAIYDELYSGKDYDAEARLITEICADHGLAGEVSLLDFGCGTGEHARRLDRLGFRVVGLDRSLEMLRVARSKTNIGYVCSDLSALALQGSFDVGIAMFAVVGYLLENADVFLRRLHEHLRPGGLFIFDRWDGDRVTQDPPQVTERSFVIGTQRVRRTARPSSGDAADSIEVAIDVEAWDGSTSITFGEVHRVACLSREYSKALLEDAGFTYLETRDLPGEHSTDRTNWSVVDIARRD